MGLANACGGLYLYFFTDLRSRAPAHIHFEEHSRSMFERCASRSARRSRRILRFGLYMFVRNVTQLIFSKYNKIMTSVFFDIKGELEKYLRDNCRLGKETPDCRKVRMTLKQMNRYSWVWFIVKMFVLLSAGIGFYFYRTRKAAADKRRRR